MRTLWPACIALVLVGCGSGEIGPSADRLSTEVMTADAEVDGSGHTGADAASLDGSLDAGPEPPACLPGSSWSAETAVFQERTSAWGLDGVEGAHLSITHVDGDGWPDLVVRAGGGNEDFSPGGARNNWLLRNTGMGAFEDITQKSGVFASRLDLDPMVGVGGRVVASGDVDNDGDLDIFVARVRTDLTAEDGETSELMLNNGDGTFSLGPEYSDARFVDAQSSPAGVSFVDFDRDGFLDLWVVHNELPGLTAMQDTLLKGNGEGRFADVTLESGLGTLSWKNVQMLNEARAHTRGWGSAACDLNNDGYPELLASSYGRAPNHLWRGGKSPTATIFLNESISSGYAFDHRTNWTTNLSAQCYCADVPFAVACGSCPEPADPEMCSLLKTAFGENYRWNHTYGREPFNLGGNTGTTVCADINNDGHLDLITHEIVHFDVGDSSDPSELLLNTGEAELRFERPGSESTGISRQEDSEYWDRGDMSGAVFDFDNDGWQDVYIGSAEYAGNRARLYRQNSPAQFAQLATDDFFLHYRAHGVTTADFDRDGDLDIVVGHSHHRCEGFEGTECMPTTQIRFFENIFGAQNNWLQVRLEGTDGLNKSAVGARVEVTAGDVTQTREVDGGHGRFGLQNDPTLHFGIGSSCEAQVKVIWPDPQRTAQSFSAYANQRYLLRTGEEATTVDEP